MIAITTSNSMSVNPRRRVCRQRHFVRSPHRNTRNTRPTHCRSNLLVLSVAGYLTMSLAGCCLSGQNLLKQIRRFQTVVHSFFETLWLTEQLFVIGCASAFCADMRGITHMLPIESEIRFQELLHFTKRFRHGFAFRLLDTETRGRKGSWTRFPENPRIIDPVPVCCSDEFWRSQ